MPQICPNNNWCLILCTVFVECQVQCFNACGAYTVAVSTTISECCNTTFTGGTAFIDLQYRQGGCQTCVDVGSELKHN